VSGREELEREEVIGVPLGMEDFEAVAALVMCAVAVVQLMREVVRGRERAVVERARQTVLIELAQQLHRLGSEVRPCPEDPGGGSSRRVTSDLLP
jgi:hypothetical protein